MIRLACIAAFLVVITTVGIHSNLFDFSGLDFRQRAELHADRWYHFSKWWIIIHCLLVIISMWGVALVLGRTKVAFTAPGMLFISVFGITEIFRQLLVLFYLNGLRQNYLEATDERTIEFITQNIQSFGLFAYALFGLFILAFALGNLFFGFALLKEQKLGHWLGILLIVWSVQGLMTLGNEFWNMGWFNEINKWFSLIIQPLIRLCVALWLIRWFRHHPPSGIA